MAYGLFFHAENWPFCKKIRGVMGSLVPFFNSRFCAKWGPSVAGSRLIVSETPYSGLLGQPSSTGLAGQHAAHRLLSTHSVHSQASAAMPAPCPSPAIAPELAEALRAEKERHSSECDCYSMSSSTRPSSVYGMVRPSALAVLRLMTSSKFAGCLTGRSAGFVPFKILST